MRLSTSRNTYGYLIFAMTSTVYFATGMAIGQNLLRKSATMLQLVLLGLLAVALINGALWAAFYLMRRYVARQRPSNTEEANR